MSQKVRIYQPAKNAMQSGKGKMKSWLLEFEPASGRVPDALMGWMSGEDTAQQIRIAFDSREDAIAFCQRKDLAFEVHEPHPRLYRPRSYADNFKYERIRR